MIFVTVGSELPFDRLVSAVDAWAGSHEGIEVVAQVGESRLNPKHIRCEPFMSPDRFRDCMRSAELVIAHAGMGTIISALELRKPIVVMPRRPEHREVRNSHQIATCRKFEAQGRVVVAYCETDLVSRVAEAREARQGCVAEVQPSMRLLAVLRQFIATGSYDPADVTGVGLRPVMRQREDALQPMSHGTLPVAAH